MSEFQLYQFKSIDRPLTATERKEIGSWSSRTNPTATSATFIYAYGDFPKDAEKVVEKYFDAMLYATNWGTKRLMFRLPKNLVDAEELSAYTFEMEYSEDSISLQECKSCYLLDINFHNEDGGTWLDEDDFDLDDFSSLREDILQGDYRALYLIWLQFAHNATAYQEEEDEEDTRLEPPPTPVNLSKLTATLKAVIDFFEIDQDIVTAAKKASKKIEPPALDYRKLISELSESECKEWLLRLANGEPRLELEFKKRLLK
ncbi:MAG: hypothetical protein KDD14_07340 [Saprospiraceae bacterium]|nr:hypothetical protein [Saprospiraceae bacterium]